MRLRQLHTIHLCDVQQSVLVDDTKIALIGIAGIRIANIVLDRIEFHSLCSLKYAVRADD